MSDDKQGKTPCLGLCVMNTLEAKLWLGLWWAKKSTLTGWSSSVITVKKGLSVNPTKWDTSEIKYSGEGGREGGWGRVGERWGERGRGGERERERKKGREGDGGRREREGDGGREGKGGEGRGREEERGRREREGETETELVNKKQVSN